MVQMCENLGNTCDSVPNMATTSAPESRITAGKERAEGLQIFDLRDDCGEVRPHRETAPGFASFAGVDT